MKKTHFLSFIFFLLATALSSQTSSINPFVTAEVPQYPVIANPGAYVPNQLLVMLKPNVIMGELEEEFASKGFVIAQTKNAAKSMRIWTLTFVNGTNIEKALEAAKTISAIELSQFNHYVARRIVIPNDANFWFMWNLDNYGQFGGTPDADIDAPEAWDITTGGITTHGDTIVVAVIDAGFDLAHEDLNYQKNYGEIPNNNIDDDNNGYIDDFNGWNAYTSTGNIISDMHGTHVAGIAGARGNNTLGIAGVSWGVKIMPIMGSDGTEAQVVEAYSYVFDARKLYNTSNGTQGAFVVTTNSSFGVNQGQPVNYPLWCAMYDSLGTVGILSATATANANWDIDVVGDIPTACSSIFMLAVTNTMRDDTKASNAAYGATTIDIGAPGTQVESAIPGNSYASLSGTSMACPHVAGAIALMYATACYQMITDYKLKPDSVALLVRNYLLSSADPNVALNGQCTSNGRLNIYNSLLAVQTYDCTIHAVAENSGSISVSNIFPNPANDVAVISFVSTSTENATLLVTDVLGQTIQTISLKAVAGINSVQINVADLSAGMYFVQLNCGGVSSAAKRMIVE